MNPPIAPPVPLKPAACCSGCRPSDARLEGAPTPGAARREREAEAASRRVRSNLTGVCLVALLLGWAIDATNALPRGVAIGLYVVSCLSGGWFSAQEAWEELRARQVSVDLLMILAAVGACVIGDWREGALLLFLFSLAETLEGFVLGRTRRAIQALMELAPEAATIRRVINGQSQEMRVPIEELEIGDVLLVRPGERIAADGEVLSGESSVDQAAMTGESAPVLKAPGESVFAGTLNGNGVLEIAVSRRASESALARIIQLVEQAQSERAPSQQFSDWFGQRYTRLVLVGCTLAFVVPVAFGQAVDVSLYRAITALVVACPCAVVIAVPAALLSAITGAAREGVLFKGGAHLEELAQIRAIAFDKTGTLTLGRPRLMHMEAAREVSETRVLTLAAGVESLSEHPLAHAVVEAAQERNLSIPQATQMQALVGRGARAQIEESTIWVGRPELFVEQGHQVPQQLLDAAVKWSENGQTSVFVGDQTRVLGALALADAIRPGAADALKRLREMGIEHQIMLTGDNALVAQKVAGQLGLEFEAGLLPQDKLEVIKKLREKYVHVAMMGDGINDAPSLAASSVGISPGGTATDVALETADVVLMSDDLSRLPFAIALARQTRRVVLQSLVLGLGMMLVLLVTTFAANLKLPFAVLGHEGSTLLVILNGLRLLGFRAAKPSTPTMHAERLPEVSRRVEVSG